MVFTVNFYDGKLATCIHFSHPVSDNTCRADHEESRGTSCAAVSDGADCLHVAILSHADQSLSYPAQGLVIVACGSKLHSQCFDEGLVLVWRTRRARHNILLLKLLTDGQKPISVIDEVVYRLEPLDKASLKS